MEPIVGALAARPEKKWLILNKVDIAIKEKLLVHTQRLYDQLDIAETFFVNAATGDGLPELKTHFPSALPQGPWHFPEDQVSDATARMHVPEINRAQLYQQLHPDLPKPPTHT